ncbi:MAG: hypothetical protein JSR46_09500, partial [Verrucomicrobia bacterium]|nr:hypothetical protein [Verrucomicrobiota bacterium]
ADGVRFSILQQNCNTFVVHVASLAGIEIDTRMTAPELLKKALPDMKRIPAVGTVLEAISSVVEPIFQLLDSVAPVVLKQAISAIGDALLFIPQKIATLFLNSILVCNGAAVEAEPVRNKGLNDERFPDFPVLIGSIKDFFTEGKSDMHHTWKLVEWQQKQSSTTTYRYEDVPQIHILP